MCALFLVIPSVFPVFAEVREAHVAGQFYPAEPAELHRIVTGFLDSAPAADASAPAPRILISPHAGYPYSGVVAGAAFRQVQGRRYDGVVVVAFTHQLGFTGSSVDDREAYRTPLGDIPIDAEAAAFLVSQPTLQHHEPAHASREHSLEVMLPLLQAALGEFRVVPVLMGSQDAADAEGLASALAALASRGDYLFVFSTDLSHYHPYDDAVALDEDAISAIVFETPRAVDRLFRAGRMEACGMGPILAAKFLSARLGYLEPRLLRYANSGDTAGDKSRVVGYAAIAMRERPSIPDAQRISDAAGLALVQEARGAITSALTVTPAYASAQLEQHPELQQARGVFVTLRRKADHGLRGCIGRIQNPNSLAESVATVALDAALRDHRFAPVTADELDRLTVEVSVLTGAAPVASAQQIVAGRDGVVLAKDDRSGVFLPQVWDETGWTRVEFLRELASQKAGLDPDAWKTATLLTFQDQAFTE